MRFIYRPSTYFAGVPSIRNRHSGVFQSLHMQTPSEKNNWQWKYWAFLSYSHRDHKIARWLHHSLETYRIPKQLVGRMGRCEPVPSRLFPVFRDREELPTSSDLGGNIREALRKSRYLIVVCSPAAAASRWVNEEILEFKRLGREACILCLIIAGEPNVGTANECFPPAIKNKLNASGELTDELVEPIAADLRQHGDGRRNALLKIMAGLLSVDFDSLKMRDRQRLFRRNIAIACCILIATAVATAQTLHLHQLEKSQAAVANEIASMRTEGPYKVFGKLSSSRRQAIDHAISTCEASLERLQSRIASFRREGKAAQEEAMRAVTALNETQFGEPGFNPIFELACASVSKSYVALCHPNSVETSTLRKELSESVNRVGEGYITDEERVLGEATRRSLEASAQAISTTLDDYLDFRKKAMIELNQKLRFHLAARKPGSPNPGGPVEIDDVMAVYREHDNLRSKIPKIELDGYNAAEDLLPY